MHGYNGGVDAPRSDRAARLRASHAGRTQPMFTIEIEREDDGRWIAEVADLPGVIAYGESRQQAIDRVQALSLRVLADRLEHGEGVPDMAAVFAVAP